MVRFDSHIPVQQECNKQACTGKKGEDELRRESGPLSSKRYFKNFIQPDKQEGVSHKGLDRTDTNGCEKSSYSTNQANQQNQIFPLQPIRRIGKKIYIKEVTLPTGEKVLRQKTKTRSRQKNLRKDTRLVNKAGVVEHQAPISGPS